jgi:hypothetical protein
VASFTFVPFDRSSNIGATLSAINGALVSVLAVAASTAKATSNYVVLSGLAISDGTFPSINLASGEAIVDGKIHTIENSSLSVPTGANAVCYIFLDSSGTFTQSSNFPADSVPLAIVTNNGAGTAFTITDVRPFATSKRGSLSLTASSADPALSLNQQLSSSGWLSIAQNGESRLTADATNGLKLFENTRLRLYSDDGTLDPVFDFNVSGANAYLANINTQQFFASAAVTTGGGVVGEFTQSQGTAATAARTALKLTTFGTSTVNDYLLRAFDSTTPVFQISRQGNTSIAGTLAVSNTTTLAGLSTTGSATIGNGSGSINLSGSAITLSGGPVAVHAQNLTVYSNAGTTTKFAVAAASGDTTIVSGNLRTTASDFTLLDATTGPVGLVAKLLRLGSTTANATALSVGTSGLGLSLATNGTMLIKHEAVVGSMTQPSFQIQNSSGTNVFQFNPGGQSVQIFQVANSSHIIRAHASQSTNIWTVQNSGSTDMFYVASAGGVHTTQGLTHRAGAVGYFYNPAHNAFASLSMTASNDLKMTSGTGGYTWRNSGDTVTTMSLSNAGALITAAGATIGGALAASGLLTLGSSSVVVSNAAGNILATALTGTVADGNLSSNVALLNRTTQQWTGTTQQFGSTGSSALYIVHDLSSPNGSSLTWGDGSGWKLRFRSRAGSPISIMELTDNGLIEIPNGNVNLRGGRMALNTNSSYGNVLISGATQQAPAFTTRSTGVRFVAEAAVGGSSTDYGMGYETDYLWFSTSTTAKGFKWYGGTTLAATMTGTGALTLVGAATAQSFTVPTTSTGVVMTINSAAAETADVVKFKVKNAAGADAITMDSNGNLYVAGDFTVVGTQIISGTQNVEGSYNINGDLTVTGSSNLGDDASADTTQIFGRTRIRTHASQTGNSIEVRDTTNTSNLFAVDLTGAISAASATLTGAIDAAGANFSGAVSLGSLNAAGSVPTRYFGHTNKNCIYGDSSDGQVILTSTDLVVCLDSDKNDTGRSFSIRNNAAYATDGSEIFRVEETGKIVGTVATEGAGTEVLRFNSQTDANSYVTLVNQTGTANTFLPGLIFRTNSASTFGSIQSESTQDSGTEPVMEFNVRTSGGAAFATRAKTFRWRNFTTELMSLNAVGDLSLARGLIVGTGYGCYIAGGGTGLVIASGDAQVRSAQHVTIQLDHDNNGTDGLFRIRSNSSTTDLFTVDEAGGVTLTSGAILGLNANNRLSFATDATLYSGADVIIRVDADNNGSQAFRIQNGAGSDLMTVPETGVATLANGLTATGTVTATSTVTAPSVVATTTVSAPNLKYSTVTITAGSVSATWTHNYGSTNYAVGSTPSGTGTHVAYANKAANSIDIVLDAPQEANVDVMVILLGS